MFGFLNRESKPLATPPATGPLVGCVGKLPLHAEFIKHNLKSREVVALDNWMQEGVTLLNRLHGESWKQLFAAAPAHHFVFTGAGDEKSVYGLMMPSRDRSGRSYPFALFAASDETLYKDHQALLPLAAEPFFAEAEALLARDWNEQHVARLTEAVDGLARQVPTADRRGLIEEEMNRLRSITLGQFWRELLPGTDATLRARFVRTVVGVLQTVSRRSPQRIHWGVRLPLPGRADVMPYLLFWLQLSETLLSGRSWRGHYFWNTPVNGHPARLTLFFRPLPASYFARLVEPQKADGAVFDVLDEMHKEPGDTSRLADLIAREEVTLLDALTLWRSREVLA